MVDAEFNRLMVIPRAPAVVSNEWVDPALLSVHVPLVACGDRGVDEVCSFVYAAGGDERENFAERFPGRVQLGGFCPRTQLRKKVVDRRVIRSEVGVSNDKSVEVPGDVKVRVDGRGNDGCFSVDLETCCGESAVHSQAEAFSFTPEVCFRHEDRPQDRVDCQRFGLTPPGQVHVIALPVDRQGIARDVGVGREVSVATDGADFAFRGTAPYIACPKPCVALRLSLHSPLRSGRGRAA